MRAFAWGAMVACAGLVACGGGDQPAKTGADGRPLDDASAGPATDGSQGEAGERRGADDKRSAQDGTRGDAPESTGPAKPAPVKGPFSEARVQEIVRANFDKLGACYAKGLERDKELKGTVNVSLTIDGEGAVVRAQAPKSDKPKPKPKKKKKKRFYWEKKKKEKEAEITDVEVVTCLESEFKGLRFPPTGRGLVTLVYPVVFRTE